MAIIIYGKVVVGRVGYSFLNGFLQVLPLDEGFDQLLRVKEGGKEGLHEALTGMNTC